MSAFCFRLQNFEEPQILSLKIFDSRYCYIFWAVMYIEFH